MQLNQPSTKLHFMKLCIIEKYELFLFMNTLVNDDSHSNDKHDRKVEEHLS